MRSVQGWVLALTFTMSVAAAAGSPSGPRNYAILIDTSGSMIALYQRRDPKPTVAVDLVQRLVRETMAPHDRLAILTFDHEVHDGSNDILAYSALDPETAVREIGELRLSTRPGLGTVRTAALGRGVKALEDLATSDKGGFGGGLIYVVTDQDDDQRPDGAAAKYYEAAVALQGAGQLVKVGRVQERSLLLEVWRVAPQAGSTAARATDPAAVILQLRHMLPELAPEGQPTPAPVVNDFERGTLKLLQKGSWSVAPGRYELPVEVRSDFQALTFRGQLGFDGAVMLDRAKRGSPQVALRMAPEVIDLKPGDAPVAGVLEVSGLPRPSLLQLRLVAVAVSGKPTAQGVLTSDPRLLTAKDPVATAKVVGALWLAEQTVQIALEPQELPAAPPVKPPRVQQVVLLLLLLLALWGVTKVRAAARPPEVTLWYRDHENPGMDHRLELGGTPQTRRDLTASGAVVVATRAQREAEVTLTAGPGCQLLDMNQAPTGRLLIGLTGGQMLFVQGADGQLVGLVCALVRDKLTDPPGPSGQGSTGLDGEPTGPGLDATAGGVDAAGTADDDLSDDRL